MDIQQGAMRELALFAGAGGVSSGATCSDGERFAQLSVMPTQHKFSRNDKTMDVSRLSQFGLTCAVLTEDHGEELLTSYRAGFRVRTYPQQDAAQGSKESDQVCGQKWQESFAKYDRDSRTWRIAQRSLFEDLGESLETWPRWGMTVNGESFHVETLAEFTYESGYGLSLPTTGASEGRGSQRRRYSGSPEFRGAKMSEGLRTCESDPIYLNPLFAELAMMWPLGWTDLKPLEMARFHEWQRQHSGY